MSPKGELERWLREDEEARRVREESADWRFIESQPEPLKTALKVLVETGDLWLASKVAGLSVSEFNEFRLKARIPLVV